MLERKRFDELDALRGIAALAVVLFHYTRYVTVHNHFGDFPGPFAIGERGVQLFFMVSGFVIYFTLERSKSVKDFAFSRFSRLYPTYWASLAICALFGMIVLHHKPWLSGYAVNVTMLQSFLGVQDLDVVYWTLGIELAFYFWIGTFFAAGWLKRITPFALTWLALSCAWAIGSNFMKLPAIIGTYFIPQHIPYFMAGVAFRRIHTDGWKPAYIAILAFAMADNYLLKGVPELIASAALFSVFGLAVSGKLKFLKNRVLLWLGAISYPLYVTHRNIGYEVLQLLHDHGMSSLLSVPLVTVGALALGAVVTYKIERPAMRLLREWYTGRQESRRMPAVVES